MQVDTRYGQYWDSQAVAQYSILPYFRPSELTHAIFILNDRLAKLTAGRVAARDHKRVELKLQELDRNLRLRWEFDPPDGQPQMWAIDRFAPDYGYHFTICFWSHRFGQGEALRAILEDGDMQRPDYLKRKKRYQEYALLSNAKKREEMALSVVDGMSKRQVEEFIQVENALRTGEKIRSYGKDADMLNRMHENTKKIDAMVADGLIAPCPLPGRESAINPHQHSLDFLRTARSRRK